MYVCNGDRYAMQLTAAIRSGCRNAGDVYVLDSAEGELKTDTQNAIGRQVVRGFEAP
jgi:hypothetical protein